MRREGICSQGSFKERLMTEKWNYHSVLDTCPTYFCLFRNRVSLRKEKCIKYKVSITHITETEFNGLQQPLCLGIGQMGEQGVAWLRVAVTQSA